MLNPNGLDPGGRGFPNYGQQAANAGFPLGGLQGGLQGGLPGVRAGGLAGLQAATAASQQPARQQFANALQANLPSNLQQLGQYAQAQRGTLANAQLANGVLGTATAGVRAQGLTGLGPLIRQQPGVGDRGAPGGLNLAGIGAAGAGLSGLQGYSSLAAGTQNAMSAALQNQQRQGLALGLNQLSAAAGLGGLQSGLQNRLQLGNAGASLNLLQQGLSAAAGTSINPSQDLLALISRQSKPPAGAAGVGAVGATDYSKLGLRTAANAVTGTSGNEFSIQNEDFPALPGAPNSARGDAGATGLAGMGQPGSARSVFGDQQAALEQLARNQQGGGGASDYEQMLRLQQQQRAQQAAVAGLGGSLAGAALLGKPGAGGGSGVDALKGSLAGAGAGAAERYGLMGLLPLIKMSDPDLTMLALGTDLTSLGLNLNSADNLHRTFVSPLADAPIKPEPEFELPACYKFPPQRLQPGYLTKFKEETLFYMFYSMCCDEAQLIAADELCTRGWWYHKRHKLWMLHAPNITNQKTPRGERGSFLIFDIAVWEVVPKNDIEILYEDIERAPSLNRPKQMPPTAARH